MWNYNGKIFQQFIGGWANDAIIMQNYYCARTISMEICACQVKWNNNNVDYAII